MSASQPHRKLPSLSTRGVVALVALVPLLLAGFVAGYGAATDPDAATDGLATGDRAQNTADVTPSAASFTATALNNPAPEAPSVLPVGTTDNLGISVTHLQFEVDESTLANEYSAELRMPVLVPPDAEAMMLEVSSVEPVSCLCSLDADSAPPYGRVWDVVHVDAATNEVVFDVTGAFDAPGRYGFAISSPDLENYLEFSGHPLDDGGPLLSVSTPAETGPTELEADQSSPGPAEPATESTPESGQAEGNLETCRTDHELVPSCGALLGAAAGAHTDLPKEQAFLDFETTAGAGQHIYHAYERGDGRVFPTPEQIALTEDAENPRTLFINWKPQIADWADIAEGDADVDAYLTRLAEHLMANYDEPFFFTVHHEPENDVVAEPGSGMEAADYAAMFRYVIEFLRDQGVDNLVTVMNYMGYLKWVEAPWHDQLYPGEDVVDWIGLSGYGQSLDDDGHSDFTEIIDQTDDGSWPGFYHWAGQHHPDKPMMLAEWGVFVEEDHPHHQETVFRAAAEQFAYYPRLKAIVYFSSPDAEGRDSEVDNDPDAHQAFQDLMQSKHFDVVLD